MADLNKMYRDLINDLDRNIKDENELKNIKGKMFDLMTYFVDSNNKIINIKDKQEKLDRNMKKIQKRLERIEDDIYIEDEEDCCGDKMHDNDYEFEIRCPYCDDDFVISEQSKSEIECPNCHNIIELDWNEGSECDGYCNKCKERCYEESEEQNASTQVKEEEAKYNTDEQNNSQQNQQNGNNNKNQDDDM